MSLSLRIYPLCTVCHQTKEPVSKRRKSVHSLFLKLVCFVLMNNYHFPHPLLKQAGGENNTVVSRKYAAPLPLATLASVQNAVGGYTRDAMISLAITPSLPVPAVKHDVIVNE